MAADANQSSKRRDFCAMHVINSAKQKLTSFTYTSWCKFVSFAVKWRKLQCREGELAIEAAANLGLRFNDLPSGVDFDHQFVRRFFTHTSLLQVPSRLLQPILQYSDAWQRRKEAIYSRQTSWRNRLV